MQSGKVRYNHREDTLLSLSIPMEAVLNKGENLCCAIVCLRHVFLCSVVVFKIDRLISGYELRQRCALLFFVFFLDEVAAYELRQKEAEEKKERL